MRRFVLVALGAAALLVPPGSGAHGAQPPFAGCQPAAAPVVVGAVECRTMRSADIGGTTAFSYFVPPDCVVHRCPTLYLLHGFGGDLTSMLGTSAHPSAWVAALDRQPALSPYASNQPWTESDPATWRPAPQLDVVLVAPDGRTVPGGRGPASWIEGFWADWNPRYARGGSDARYPTAPPKFASYVVDELVPFVERHFPVAHGRAARALVGTSLGGYGSYSIGLTHPDMWSSIGAVSGIMNILLAHAVDSSPGRGGVQPPTQLPAVGEPSVVGGRLPLADLPGPAADLGAVFYVFGDPSTDQGYYRGAQPVDLATNAAAHRGRQQSLVVRGFSNDTVPRQSSDVTSFPGYLVAQGFEDFVFASNVEMNRAFRDEGVTEHYELHPGIHSDAYWNPWLRSQLQAQYDALRHWDGSGHPPPTPSTFAYSSEASSFRVWGWWLSVRRPVLEFLHLTDVSCHGFTVRGTGVVQVTVPPGCHTGVHGSRHVTVDLGPSMPADAPGGADAAGSYGRTVRVTLTASRR